MTKYREILRLKSLGFSERNIAQSCGVSRNTVAKVLKKAAEINLSWPLDFDMTDSALEELMFPKTYMACAFGMEACKHYYSVRYVRLPDLLLDLQAARDNGTFSNALKKYTKPIVLILDEWLLLKLTEAEARNLFELIHKRRKKSSTIFCSQFRESEWYQQICDGESTLADAIMDRISYDSYKIDIESVDPAKDLSMREVYGLDPAMAK